MYGVLTKTNSLITTPSRSPTANPIPKPTFLLVPSFLCFFCHSLYFSPCHFLFFGLLLLLPPLSSVLLFSFLPFLLFLLLIPLLIFLLLHHYYTTLPRDAPAIPCVTCTASPSSLLLSLSIYLPSSWGLLGCFESPVPI